MSSKSNAPKAPDYSGLANASLESAKIWEDVALKQLDWAKTTDQANRDVLDKVLGVQLPQLEDAYNAAKADRQRYETLFQPLETKFVQEAQAYDTPERRAAEAARREADVNTQFEAQRQNALKSLEGYGIDPSQTRMGALDLGYRAQQAAAAALAGNQGRLQVEQTGRALEGEAINIGKGYPSQVAQSQGIVNQTAGGAVGNSAATTGAGATAYGTAIPFASTAMSGVNSAANIQNLGYQNALARFNANQAGTGGFWGGLGSLAGELGSAWLLGGGKVGGAEGGKVPEDLGIPAPSDRVPALLAHGEYVIPADVMRRKGTEFFDKLIDKYKDAGEYEQARSAAAAEDNARQLSRFTPSYDRVKNSPAQPFQDQQLMDRSYWEDVAAQQAGQGIPMGK